MKFHEQISSSIQFQRLDNKQSVAVNYNPSAVAVDPMIATLMQKILNSSASREETGRFKLLWQQRVADIFDNIDKITRVL